MQLVERVDAPGQAVDAGQLTIEDLVDATAFTFREHATQPAAEQRLRPLQPGDPQGEDEYRGDEHNDDQRKGPFVEDHRRGRYPFRYAGRSLARRNRTRP